MTIESKKSETTTMTTSTKQLLSVATLLFGALTILPACDDVVGDNFRRTNHGTDGDGTDGTSSGGGANDPTQPGTCEVGAPHVGFGQNDFVSDRAVGALAVDRRRVKPFSALDSEMKRVLGSSPAALGASASAFGDVPARWYSEPVAGAVSLYSMYSLAFTACYDSMGDAAHQAAPTTATATAECAALQKKAWQRAPTAEETATCADLAVVKLASEPIARRRWAHACASVLSSAGFVSY